MGMAAKIAHHAEDRPGAVHGLLGVSGRARPASQSVPRPCGSLIADQTTFRKECGFFPVAGTSDVVVAADPEDDRRDQHQDAGDAERDTPARRA